MDDNSFHLPRIYAPLALSEAQSVTLPPAATRHIQVLRMQPQQMVCLFNGEGGQWPATITEMGKNSVQVLIGAHQQVEREARIAVSLLIGIPANERMDFLIEKATELGVAQIYPLIFSRSVVKLNTERASKKLAHWQAIAIAACEQCGRNRIPQIHPVFSLSELIQNQLQNLPKDRRVLSFQKNAHLWTLPKEATSVCILSGPEGGLALEEENRLISQADFLPYSLGSRVLRADTAPLAALSTCTL
ncbi:MAG: 16S rRNA (uracil(1498)-N(3))-methyltransferase [Saezia sp.]